MPISTGFNHVATVTADLDRAVEFYRDVFDAAVTFEIPARDDHPRMVALDLGGGSVLNIAETTPEDIVGDRTKQGGRGQSTTTASPSTPVRPSTPCETGSSPPAPTSATSNRWATSGRCSSVTPTARSSRSAPPLTARARPRERLHRP